MQTLDKLYVAAAEKYAACCREYRRFHLSTCSKKTIAKNEFLKRIDLNLAQIIYVVIHSFFKYLVCNVRGGTVFDSGPSGDYHEFFRFSLSYFANRFAIYKNEFSVLHKILQAKVKKVDQEKLVF